VRLAAVLAGLLAASPVAAQKAGDRGFGQSAVASSIALTRRAVIIGINRYLHFTNLRYADSDAVAFYNYLTSESGGAVPPGNIRLLLDSNATAEAIDDSLGWLMRPSHGGDDAIIYFAGHGDVDTTSGQEEAYFLASDAVTNRYRTRGTLSLKTLNAFVEGIARQGRHVLLFTDACRSGWLVGQKSRATRTIAALLGEEDGVGKLLSSGAGEPSQENDQWGGGHGVFTYFLIAGLEGLADERPNGNGDGIVTLWELEKYVSDNVLRETKQSQSPVRFGVKGQQVARVHGATLRAALVAVRGPVLQPLPRLSGGSGVVTPSPDPALARPLGAFHAAIARHALLEPPDSNAWEVYRRLTTLRSAAPILTALRDTLVTALRDDVEGVIRDYQAAGRSQPSAGRLRRAARELSRAAELLGPHSGLADSVRARQLFFEGYAAVREGRYDQALDSLQQSLALEPDAANVHNALGFAYLGLSRLTDARLAFSGARARAPGWWYPIYGLGLVNVRESRLAEVGPEVRRASGVDSASGRPRRDWRTVERDYVRGQQMEPKNPTFSDLLGRLYLEAQRSDLAESAFRACLRLDPDYPAAHEGLAQVFEVQGHPSEAASQYRRAVALDQVSPRWERSLASFYFREERFAEADSAIRLWLAFDSTHAEWYRNLGLTLHWLGRDAEAEGFYRRAVALDSVAADSAAAADASVGLGNVYWAQGKVPAATASWNAALRFDRDNVAALNNVAWASYGEGAVAAAAISSDRTLAREAALSTEDLRRYLETRANIWLDAGDATRALQLFDRALASNPGPSSGLLLGRAMALIDLGRAPEAVAAFRQAVGVDVKYGDRAFLAGTVRYSAKALARFDRLRALAQPT